MTIQVTLTLKGTQFYDAQTEFKAGRLKDGAQLFLKHTPDNPHDSNAVAVFLKQNAVMLGHLSRQSAPKYAGLLKANQISKCWVKKVEKGSPLGLKIGIIYEQQDGETQQFQKTALWKSASSLPKSGGVYLIDNQNSKRIYVGSAQNIKQRAKDHIKALNARRHHNTPLQLDFNKYGPNSFIIKVHKLTDTELIEQEEAKAIHSFLSSGCDLYNKTLDGKGRGYQWLNESDDKSISDKLKKEETKTFRSREPYKKDFFSHGLSGVFQFFMLAWICLSILGVIIVIFLN